MSVSKEWDEQIRLERLREIAAGTGIEARRARYALHGKRETDACPQGHKYTPENTIYEGGIGRRRCLTCHSNTRIYQDKTKNPRADAKQHIELKPTYNGRDEDPKTPNISVRNT